MKKTLIVALACLCILGIAAAKLGWFKSKVLNKQQFQILIVSQVEIDPIVELRKGFREEFTKSEFASKHNVSFVELNAQGDSALINQIADKVAVDKPNLVYVLGTPVAQAIQNRAPDVLLVQGAVTDPVAAGLAANWSGSGKKYIATSDLPPVATQLNLVHELTPSAKKIGVIYNPGEANSVAVISRLRENISDRFELVEKAVSNSADITTVLTTLYRRVDAIYIPPDNTAHAALPVIGRFCHDNKIPLYASVQTALKSGALATLSLDFVQLGRESADLTLDVLNGKDPATIPIAVNRNPAISISSSTARLLGIDLHILDGKPNVTILE